MRRSPCRSQSSPVRYQYLSCYRVFHSVNRVLCKMCLDVEIAISRGRTVFRVSGMSERGEGRGDVSRSSQVLADRATLSAPADIRMRTGGRFWLFVLVLRGVHRQILCMLSARRYASTRWRSSGVSSSGLRVARTETGVSVLSRVGAGTRGFFTVLLPW